MYLIISLCINIYKVLQYFLICLLFYEYYIFFLQIKFQTSLFDKVIGLLFILIIMDIIIYLFLYIIMKKT